MSSTTIPIPDAGPGAASAAEGAPLVEARARDVAVWAVTMIVLLGLYLALQNPYWVPGGDSEVYLTIARNLATGKGYTFNGQPVSMVPPGWPLVLAGAMKIWPAFLFLKLINLSCMVWALGIGYWICRRFASPSVCALAILLSGILSHVYPLTFWLHSDPLFCLVSTAALLLAMQISEGRGILWRGPLLVALCFAAVMVRWAGLLSWLLVAGALLSGELKPRVNRRWVLVLLTAVIAFGTFKTLRWYLKVPKDVQEKIKLFGGTGETGGDESLSVLIEKADATVAQGYTWIAAEPAQKGWRGYLGRITGWGNWYSYLLWQPFRLGRSNALLGLVGLLVGWAVLAPLLFFSGRAALQRQWLWPALMLYSLALALSWTHPNARYLVPVCFLVIVGFFKSLEMIRTAVGTAAASKACHVLLGYFAAGVILCNAALWGVDAWVAHAQSFYEAYEAGINRDLINAAHWLREHPPADGEIAVSERYVNLGKPRISRLGLRATAMLTGKAIVSIPAKYCGINPASNRHALRWANQWGIKYFLYQPEVSPWRLFHFRTPWLQEAMTGEPAIDTGAGWRLYKIVKEGETTRAVRVSIPPTENWPTRVPGM